MNTKDLKTQSQQPARYDADTETKIREQANEQTDNFGSGLFSSAFAHVTGFPEMCEGYKALNARMRAKKEQDTTADASSAKNAGVRHPAFTADLSNAEGQPTLH